MAFGQFRFYRKLILTATTQERQRLVRGFYAQTGKRMSDVATFLLFPLFCAWIAGDAGNPDFSSWIVLLVFFAIFQLNRARRDTSATAVS
jgi:hypothetical protein